MIALFSEDSSLSGYVGVILLPVQLFLCFVIFFVKCETFFFLSHFFSPKQMNKDLFYALAKFHWVFEKDKHSQTVTPSSQMDGNHVIRKILVSIMFSSSLGSEVQHQG